MRKVAWAACSALICAGVFASATAFSSQENLEQSTEVYTEDELMDLELEALEDFNDDLLGISDRRDRRDRRYRPRPPRPYPYPSRYNYVCYAQDGYGYRFSAVGPTPQSAQNRALNECHRRSYNGCYATGCNVYSRRVGH